METTSHCRDITESGVDKNPNGSECISSQPTANGTLPHHSTDWSEDGDISDDSLMSSSSTIDICRLLPPQSISALKKQKGVNSSLVSSPPICTPPSSSITSPPPPPVPPPPPSPSSRSSTCKTHSCDHPPPHNHHQSTNQNRLSSTKSNTSFKSDAVHIKEVAGDGEPIIWKQKEITGSEVTDCCVHCVLACLFCELLSMCSAVGECLACGVGGAGCCNAAVDCCCCMEAAGEAACTEEACQAILDCGILENWCGSSDCLEICLECCSICFPS
ncbi:hypothetical protein INR49_018231 [Caranx melampygus]|nr:hypothetical protein INR49_018231 [Caranx melampygus]